jgi:hypothetical protein
VRIPTLYQFFRHQVQRGLHDCGLHEPGTIDYVSEVLTRFAETRSLHAVTDRDGRPIEYLVDFLAEQARALDARNRARAEALTRHLGEYALFMSGFFRERLTRRGELNYYLARGASAYGQCADHERHPPRRQVFRRVHENFSSIANTLDHMRRQQLPLAAREGASAPHPLAPFWRR